MGSSSPENAPSVTATAVVVIASSLALYRYYNIRRKCARLGNFPFSTPSFFPSIDLLHAIRAGALEKFVQSRKEAVNNDCFYIRLPGMGNPTLVVTNPKDQAELMRKEGKLNLFVAIGNTLDHTHGPGSLQAISGKHHAFYRKIFASLISPVALKSFIPHLFDAFTQMWDDLEKQCLSNDDKEVVIQDAICEAQFYLMSKILYGMTTENTPKDLMMQMRDDFEAQLEGHFAPPISAKYKKAKKGSQRIHAILRERFQTVLEERRSLVQGSEGEKKGSEEEGNRHVGNAMETVADALIKEGKDSDPKVLDEIIDNLDLLLEASHGTTMTVTTNTMYYLSLPENATKLQKLREEAKSFGQLPTYENLRNDMPYAQGAIYESMRLAPIITSVAFAVKDDNTGFTFKGQKMQGPVDFMMSWGQNFFDETYFKNAETFLPERWISGSKEHVSKEAEASFTPFGMGRHICLGYRLAVLVMKSALFCFAKDQRRVIEFDEEKTCKKPGLFPAYSISDGFCGRVVRE